MNRFVQSLSIFSLTVLLSGAALAGGAGAPNTPRPVSPVTTPAASTSTSSLAKLSARELLSKAIEANGGKALRNLKNSVGTANIEYYDAQGQVVSRVRTDLVVDYVTGQSRQSLYNGESLASTLYLTRAGGFTTSAQSGTVPMPRQETQTLKDTFHYGTQGLLKGELPGSVLKNLGEQTWLNVGGNKLSGTVLEIQNAGVKGTFMLSPTGELMAERYPVAPLGETISVYSQRYTLDGVLTPKVTAVFVPNGALVFTMTDTGLKMNQTLAPDTFVVPE